MRKDTDKEVLEIPLDSLLIGNSQVRLRDVEAELDELTESIRIHGLLEPIVVMPSQEPGKYELVSGQRRLLAHQRLRRPSIMAVVVPEVDVMGAKILGLTENVVRKDLDAKDVVDVCTALFRKYGTAIAVADETGIPYSKVLKYVKYERLTTPLRQLIDGGNVSLDSALAAQDIATDPETKHVDEGLAFKAAQGMSSLSRVEVSQLKRRIQGKRSRPSQDAVLDEIAGFVETRRASNRQLNDTVILRLTPYDANILAKLADEQGTSPEDVANQILHTALMQYRLPQGAKAPSLRPRSGNGRANNGQVLSGPKAKLRSR
jgi:ParB family chromosome partitioning protein